jgi:hypothetical protein
VISLSILMAKNTGIYPTDLVALKSPTCINFEGLLAKPINRLVELLTVRKSDLLLSKFVGATNEIDD